MVSLFRLVAGFFSNKDKVSSEKHAGDHKFTIKFDPSVVTKEVERRVYEAILCRPDFADLAPVTLKAIHEAVMGAIRRGGSQYQMRLGVEKAVPGFEKMQTHGLVRHLHNVAFCHIELKKTLALGIEEAEWRYSGGPCITHNPPSDEKKREGCTA